MRGGFQMVVHIPYPAMIPKYFAVDSEVATMALLCCSGLPIPEGIWIFACARQRGRD
jgi:hypothetical protein